MVVPAIGADHAQSARIDPSPARANEVDLTELGEHDDVNASK